MTLESLRRALGTWLRRGAVLAVLLVATLAATPPAQVGAPPRVVVVGDIHGAYDNLVEILERAGLIDDTLRWSGGNATLVQTGDMIDRGPGVRRVLDLFITLEARSHSGGGRLINLLGNHEVMNLVGQMNYTTPAIFASFADAQSETRRESAYRAYAALAAERRAARPNAPAVYRKTRDEWMAEHPPGFVEYREALSPRGEYGRWLREKPIATMVGDTIFMHAGVDPDNAPDKLEDLNTRVRDEIRRYDALCQQFVDRKVALPFFTLEEVLEVSSAEIAAASAAIAAARDEGVRPDLAAFDPVVLENAQQIVQIGSWSAMAGEGPLWFRGYARWASNPENTAKIDALFARYGARHIVVGHTTMEDGAVAARFGGRVFLIDTGMLSSYYKGGQATALEIDDGRFVAIYRDRKVALGGDSAR